MIQSIYKLGPSYLGSFQSLPTGTKTSTKKKHLNNFEIFRLDIYESNSIMNNTSLISEDKIMCGIHAQNIFEMTLSKFRKVYNKNDSKAIAKHVRFNESI